jgi:hypothetical protein
MSDVMVSGLFAVIGTALGWGLSEAGAGWRSHTERRRAQQSEATARVFDAARTAVGISEGLRWLIEIDVDNREIGKGFGTEEYRVKAVELAGQVQQLRLIALAVTAKGPRSAQSKVDNLVRQTQKLWKNARRATRPEIAENPGPLLNDCDQVVKIAQELVCLPASDD